MTLVDYWPQLVAHKPPGQPYPLTSFNITGWLSFKASSRVRRTRFCCAVLS